MCLTFISCQQDKHSENPVEQPNAILKGTIWKEGGDVEYIPIGSPTGRDPFLERFKQKKSAADITPEEIQEVQEAEQRIGVPRARMLAAILKSESWQEADREVRQILPTIADKPLAFRVEQSIANRMLKIRLLNDEPVGEKREAIAFYTELLLRNANPDAELVLQALTILEYSWARKEIAQAARQTAKAAREYLKSNPCKPCLEKVKLRPDQVEKLFDAQQRKLYKMQNSLPKLDELAKRES